MLQSESPARGTGARTTSHPNLLWCLVLFRRSSKPSNPRMHWVMELGESPGFPSSGHHQVWLGSAAVGLTYLGWDPQGPGEPSLKFHVNLIEVDKLLVG